MRPFAMFFILVFVLAACQAGSSRYLFGGRDPFLGGVQDYYYGGEGDPTDNDPEFSEGWAVDGAGG